MDMRQFMKEFIVSARDFENQKNLDSITQSLQILSTADDLSVFDPGSFEAVELYTLLHDLLTHHGSEQELVWCIVSVLQVVVRNPDASTALVQSYHFIHPLTTLLETQITSERKSTVLRIIQELSYGVEICWQEVHLPKLIGMLLDMISGDETELIPTALGVLVNLCHRNKPAIYTLVNCVDIKQFLRTILNLQRENVETSVQVCKLLMVLNHLSGNVPDTEILSFVRMSFLRLNKAFNCGNISLMRHIVDFFRDAKDSDHGRKVLLTYSKYEEEVETLINSIVSKEVPNSWQCVHQLVNFLQQLIELGLSSVVPLFPKLTHAVLPWTQTEAVGPAALQLISAMLEISRNRDEDVHEAVCSCIENNLQMLVALLHSGCRIETSKSDMRESVTRLLQLLRDLAAHTNLCSMIACQVDKEELKKLLLPLVSLNNHNVGQLFQQPVTALYVEVLSFIYQLSVDDGEWLLLYSDLLQKKQILKALAIALYSGTYEVKKQILSLAGTRIFSKECLTVFSKCLTDLNQLFLLSPNTSSGLPDKTSCQTQIDFLPTLTKSQREGLDNLIEKLNDLCKKNQIQDASVAGIIELYSYKVGEMRRAERWLQSSLGAADGHRSHLSHRVSQLGGEAGRLHQLLYCSHQTLEGVNMEQTELKEKLNTVQLSAINSHKKFKQLQQDVQSKSIIIKEQAEEILKLRQINDEHVRQFNDLEQKFLSLTETTEEQNQEIQELDLKNKTLEEEIEKLKTCVQKLEAEKSDLQIAYTKLEEKLSLRDKLVLEREILVGNQKSQIQSLEQEMSNQQCRIKALEKTIKEREQEISTLQTQLIDLERMRKLIFEISGKKANS